MSLSSLSIPSLSTRLVPPPPATSSRRRPPRTTGAGGFRISLAVLASFPARRPALDDVAATTAPSSSSSSRSSCLLLQRVAQRPPARLPVPMLVPAMELLGTDTAHRTTGRSGRGTSLHEAQTKISRNLLPICLPHLAARQQDSGTLIAGRIGARDLPPPQIRTGIPQHQLPSVQQLPNRKHTTQERQRRHELQLEKRKKRDLFCPVLHRKQRLGWGRTGVGNLGVGSKSNLIAGNREAPALGRSPLRSCSQ